MKIIKESVNTDSIKVGDLISYDSNYLGVTPRIHKGKVIEIGRGLGSHGDPRAPKIFTVRDEEGKKYKVDEYAVEEIITESYSENQLFNEIKNICLSDVKDWSNIIKESVNLDEIHKGDLVDFGPYGKLYVCDPYYHDNYFWVTDDKDERYNENAPGWSIFKDDAESIIYEDEDDEDEDY